MNILIGNYNNYFNRQVKSEATLDDYEDVMEAANTSPLPITYENINFNPNDGVSTELILGKGISEQLNIAPDYLVVYDSDEAIESRWFILDCNRTRGGQWKFNLRRDVLVDFPDAVESAPIYVEKGIISDLDSPLLCNNESLTVNQIKTNEVLLNDKSACPWLVMYLKKGVLGNNTIGTAGKITVDVPGDNVNVYEELSTPITSWSYYEYSQYGNTDYKYNNGTNFIVDYKSYDARWQQTSGRRYVITSSVTSSLSGNGAAINNGSNLQVNAASMDSDKSKLDGQFKVAATVTSLKTYANTAYSYKSSNSILLGYNGKIIKDSNGKYFKVTVYESSTGTDKRFITTSEASALKDVMKNKWNAAMTQSVSPNDKAFRIEIKYINYRIKLDELTDVETTVDFANYNGTGTIDSPLYDVIAMPYGDLTIFVGWEVSAELDETASRSMAIMNSLATQLGTSYVLDLQVLPYCPVPDVLNDYYDEEGKIAILEDVTDTLAIYASDMEGATDAILVCPRCQDITFDISKSISITDSSDVPDAFKTKYINDCTLFRLCSPNYNGLFEFNLAKNGGKVEKFNVDLTLKPFNPYIHVNPDFNFLYGYDFNDVRGLICNGDFSLGFVNDAWVQYEIQNKNYQAIFDRQIQNLDRNNAINKQEAIAQAVAGTFQGAGTGATAGFMAGGGWGAAAGAIIGGVGAGVGGALDIANLDRRQTEAKNYAIDNYNLSLGNVRALPYSITKTSCLTANNKLFPFVEIYECKEEEKEAYYAKLKYDGMTVGKIGKIDEFRGSGENFFKGQVIRLPDLKDDSHVANAIYEEIMKGVYI